MKNTEETTGVDPKVQGKVVSTGTGAKAEGKNSNSKTVTTKNEVSAQVAINQDTQDQSGIQTKKANQSQIKFISNSDPIEVNPGEIHFKDIQVNQTYEITLYVRNLTKTARRIRVFQPQLPAFRADYEMQGAIAAGLAMRITVTFETTYLDNFKDVMRIVSDDNFAKEIPLFAYQPCAQIIFEPFINFGFVKVQQVKKEKIFFKNEGTVSAKVDLKSSDPADLKVEPVSFTIAPKQELSVDASYESQEAGLFRGFISVNTEAACLQKTIDINATSVEFTKFLIDENGNQSTQFDFGTFYYGEHRHLEGYLVNNTPKKYKFKVGFRFGLLYSSEDIASLQTPHEVGREQTEKIMSVEPSEGVIESYSQMPIKFKCHSQVHPKHQFWTQSYAISKDEMNAEIEDFSYSAIFTYEGIKETPTIIHVTGRGICPTVRISKSLLQYGECNVNDYKDSRITIENKNPNIPINISCNKIPYFSLSPTETTIEPKGIENFIATFRPKAVGSFQKCMHILLLDGAYKLELKMLGKALDIGEKIVPYRGVEMLPENFENEHKFVDDENLFQARHKKQFEDRINEVPEWVSSHKDPKLLSQYLNSKKYDDIVRDHRKDRVQKEKDTIVNKKYNEMRDKLKALGKLPEQEDDNAHQSNSDEEEQKEGGKSQQKVLDAPVDVAYEVGMLSSNVEISELPLPDAKEDLFVNKPIGKYLPSRLVDNQKSFKPDPNTLIKKKWHSKPSAHKEVREIAAKLTGEQLFNIFAGPVLIDFGPVYVKSTMTKTFSVRNDLRTAISCRLIVDCEELKNSYKELQIIPPSQLGGFDVELMSKQLGQFRNNVKYLINEIHSFEFQVVADIQLVKLELSRNNVKMQFFDDNHEMVQKETLKLSNSGNAVGKFEWLHTNFKIFTVSPQSGEVPPGSSINLTLTYRPSQQMGAVAAQPSNNNSNAIANAPDKSTMAAITRTEEERLSLKIIDGAEVTLKCTGIFQEAKCILKTASLDLKEIAVSKAETRTFTIKNQSRIQAIFSIEESTLPECLTISPMKGRISPDDQRDISVTFLCPTEKQVKGDIVVLIRGGRVLRLPFTAQTIIPQVEILEPSFDFGNITTLGNSGVLEMTLVNNSAISADLVLDMRTDEDSETAQPGIECLQIEVQKGESDDSILHSVHADDEEEEQKEDEQGQNILANAEPNEPPDFNENDESTDSMEGLQVKKQSKLFNLSIDPGQTIKFTLKFIPKEVIQYNLVLPLTLSGYGSIPSLQRLVQCKGLLPKFLIDPQVCEFARKVITTPDKCVGDKMQVTLNNPDRSTVKWRLDTSTLTADKIFSVEPSQGEVRSFSSQIIEATFNPYAPGTYNQTLLLYIEDDPEIPSNVPYVELTLKGEAAFPRLQFDRKEVILPVVPLGVESRCTFRIINDGYENLNLKYRVIQDISQINVKLSWPDGKNVGITKHKIRVEAVFSNNKPLSFTTRLEFIDDSDRVYPIHVSGTTDNCLFTNYPYLQRAKGEYTLCISDNTNIQQQQNLHSKKDISNKDQKNNNTTAKSNSNNDQSSNNNNSSQLSSNNNNNLKSVDSADRSKDDQANNSAAPIIKGQFVFGNIWLNQEEEDVNSIDGRTQTSRTHSIAVANNGNKKRSINGSVASYGSNKSAMSLLGYQPIPTASLDSSVEHITRWMNYHALSSPIASYPQTVIESNGQQIFDLISFLTGRSHFAYKATIDHNTKRVDRSRLLLQQYDELIRQLKTEGAMLNHIRPEYLLSFQDYLQYIKTLPSAVTNAVSFSVLRMPQSRYQYLSVDTWITLFYQILKIYFLNRLNARTFKLIPGIPAEKMALPGYLDHSNLISPAESIILYWLETFYELTHTYQMKRLCNTEKQLCDGWWFSSIIQSYVGKSSNQYFSQMRLSCVNEADFKYNAEIIINAMREIGLNSHADIQDFSKPSMREQMLFSLQLLQSLPHYIPKGNPIIFSCVLGEEVAKNIELTNPTNRTICYTARLEGHLDFAIDSDEQFMIEPKSSFKFRVKFTSRVSDPVSGRIVFNNKKESNVQAAALVFDLKSNVTGRISERTIQVSSYLYEQNEIPIQVSNKFNTSSDWGEFELSIIHVKPEPPQEKKKKRKNLPGNATKANGEQDDQPKYTLIKPEDQAADVFPSFFCRQYNTNKIRIKRGGTVNITLIFLPLLMETQKCYLIFKDSNIGEFQYEITGTVELPSFGNDFIKLPLTNTPIYVDEGVSLEVPISYQNEQMNKARKTVEQLIMEKSKERFLRGDKSALQKADKLVFPGGQPDQIIYSLELLPQVPFLTMPSTLVLNNPYKGANNMAGTNMISPKSRPDETRRNNPKEDLVDFQTASPQGEQQPSQPQQANPQPLNKLPVSVMFKNAVKDFKLALTLKNKAGTDIRRIRVEITAHPRPVRAQLEFRVPARQSTTQEIPLVNNSERDWNIKVTFVKDKMNNSQLFSYPQSYQKEFLVKKKSIAAFPLTFKPRWICEAECKLILQNPLTNDLFEYAVKGFGEEPIAEDHIVLQCAARQTKTYDITLKNQYTDKDVVYKVETDLLNAQGAPSIKLKAGAKGVYQLKVTPVLSGQYTGSITFTEDDPNTNAYLWYTVVLTTASPPADKVLELNSFIRQAATFEISIHNPLDTQAVFEVVVSGQGLIGNSSFYLSPKETRAYELIYSPLYVGRAKGSIAFINEQLGEKWYELQLTSEEQQIVKLPVLKTELGKQTDYKIVLENPSELEVRANARSSNTTNFEVIPSDIILKPFSSTNVIFRHSPATLDVSETSEITITTAEIGRWRYTAYGMGVPPTVFEKMEISVGIHKDFSSSVSFKNPFKELIQVQVYMKALEHNSDAFKLMLKGRKINGKTEGEDRFIMPVGGLQVLLIPFSFIPRDITKYNCEIVVAMNEKIEWRFPIEGVTQSTQATVIQTFSCKAREVLEEDFSIQLPGINKILGAEDTFGFEMCCVEPENQNLIDKAVAIKILKNTLRDVADKLEFSLKFQPLKPFRATLQFDVTRKAGGRWRYYIELQSNDPEPDDVIVMSSSLHKTASVSFKLTNNSKHYTPFIAVFSPESDSEFTVFPKSGQLESYGRDGTVFIISFTPVEYGKPKTAKLIIQTDDMMWSYLIKGGLPTYNPPQADSSLVNNKLEPEFDLRVSSTMPKNYLKDNIRKTKNTSMISKNSNSRTIQNSNDSTNMISRSIGHINNLSSSISYIAKNN